MKVILWLSIAFLSIAACTSEKDNSTSTKLNYPEIPQQILKKIENIKYLDTVKFAKVGATIHAINEEEFEQVNPSTHKLLVEKFCKQSKGYQKEVWEGENDCSWAVEKNNLERFEDWAVRHGDTLVLNLKNNKTIEFIHDKSTPEKVVYYQFKNYFPQAGFISVEEIQNGKCRITNLINENDGTKFTINGVLYFTSNQNTFLATSFNGELPLHCTNKIELYNLSNVQLTKLWHISTGNWGVSDVRFIDEKQFLIEQSTTGISAEYKFYAKVSARN